MWRSSRFGETFEQLSHRIRHVPTALMCPETRLHHGVLQQSIAKPRTKCATTREFAVARGTRSRKKSGSLHSSYGGFRSQCITLSALVYPYSRRSLRRSLGIYQYNDFLLQSENCYQNLAHPQAIKTYSTSLPDDYVPLG